MRPSHVHVPQGTSELNLAALVRAASSSDMGASGSMPPPSVSAISESASETNPDPQCTRSGLVRVTYGTLPSDAPLEPSLLAPRRPADPPLAPRPPQVLPWSGGRRNSWGSLTGAPSTDDLAELTALANGLKESPSVTSLMELVRSSSAASLLDLVGQPNGSATNIAGLE